MPDDFLTTRELARLLRIKERKVYELVGQGDVPCTKVTGKLLFPSEAIKSWLESGRLDATDCLPPSVCLGSHDPLFEWALARAGSALPSYLDSSLDGLERFCKGDGIACGLHLYHPADQSWNRHEVSSRCRTMNAVLLKFATRPRGLLVTPGSSIRTLADLAQRRLVARQPQSGAQLLLEQLLHQSDVDLDTITVLDVARDESDAALAVADGRADVAFGLEVFAARYGLDFLPIIEERFDLLVHRAAWFDEPLQRLRHFCVDDEFRDHAGTLAGYDLTGLWEPVWNA